MTDQPIKFPTTARSRPADMPVEVDVTDRLPPYDLAAEIALLGSMIIDPDVIGPVAMLIIKPDAFFDERNQILFKTILDLSEKNIPIDTLVISSTLRTKNIFDSAGGLQHLSDVVNSVPSAAHAEHYASIVKEKATLRGLIMACTQSLKDVYESGDDAKVIVDRAEKRVFDIAQDHTSKNALSISEVMQQTFEILDRNTGESFSGIPTGFIELDNLTSGLQRGEMIVLAGRPGTGKTSYAMNMVEHVGINLKKPVGVFSLEMSAQQLGQRLLCCRSQVDSHKLRRGMLSREERDQLQQAVAELDGGQIFIDDTPALTVMDLRTKARRLKAQYGIEMLMIDYLQLMEGSGNSKRENRQQEISEISRGIKAVARELNIPVVVLSQLNRSNETQERMPRSSDLRDSGAIEQDADVIMLLHREALMHRGDQDWMDANPDKINLALCIIAKQRNGPCDNVKLTFLSQCTRFVNYNPGV